MDDKKRYPLVMPTPLFVAARKRAHSLEKTLAEYLRSLVEADLRAVENRDKQLEEKQKEALYG
jgi:hypothetical protein